jgi:hypothetical protein
MYDALVLYYDSGRIYSVASKSSLNPWRALQACKVVKVSCWTLLFFHQIYYEVEHMEPDMIYPSNGYGTTRLGVYQCYYQ